MKAGRDANAQEPDETETNKVRTALEDFLTCLGTYCPENFMLSSIGTEEYPNFHGNTRLAQTQSYFNLTGNSHIVHSLDVEMDSSNWNPRGHSVDVLNPSGLQGRTRITVDLHTYEAVWSGEQVKPLFILSSVLYFNS